MSALDDAVRCLDDHTLDHTDHASAEARKELELLRATANVAFEFAASMLPWCDSHGHHEEYCHQCGKHMSSGHRVNCLVASILRTDPERAKKMGLWWAL